MTADAGRWSIALPGVNDLTPRHSASAAGCTYQPETLPFDRLPAHRRGCLGSGCHRPPTSRCPRRRVHLPAVLGRSGLATGHRQIHDRTVRKDAPWCPSNLEFPSASMDLANLDEATARLSTPAICHMAGRRVSGRAGCTPLDPRHRLVTNQSTIRPAPGPRENSVGHRWRL